MTKEGIELIKKFEGCRLTAYRCPANVWTIGYGHTQGAIEGLHWTQEQAEQVLEEDLEDFEEKVRKLLKVKLEDHQVSALVSFAFNVGIGAFKKSTLLLWVNKLNPNVRSEFMKWTKAGGKVLPGLVTRRKAEADMYEGSTSTA